MSLRAIFRFENLDSTKDLNDRFSGLFSKGVYEGGVVKAGFNNTTAVIEPFRALSADGMAIISDEDYVVSNLPISEECFIVLEAQYIIDGDPIINIKALREDQIDDTKHVKLAKKTANVYNYTDDGCSDRITQVGRNHYRGVFDANTFANIQSTFTKNDWCFVTSNSLTEIHLKRSDNNWSVYEATDLVYDRIDNHVQNVVDNTEGAQPEGGDYSAPSVTVNPLYVIDGNSTRTCDMGTEDFGSFNISSSKWLSQQSVKEKWTQQQAGYQYTKTGEYATDGKLGTFITEYFSSRPGSRFSNGNKASSTWDSLTSNLPDQRPTVNTRLITENYIMLPTIDEKWALVGNYTDTANKPSKSNRFITQKTPTCVMNYAALSNPTQSGSYYYYTFSAANANIVYIGTNSSNYASYVKPVYNSASFSVSNNTGITIMKKSGGNYTAIASGDFIAESDATYGVTIGGKGFLKQSIECVIRSEAPLSGAYFYTYSTIDNNVKPAIVNSVDSVYSGVYVKASNSVVTDVVNPITSTVSSGTTTSVVTINGVKLTKKVVGSNIPSYEVVPENASSTISIKSPFKVDSINPVTETTSSGTTTSNLSVNGIIITKTVVGSSNPNYTINAGSGSDISVTANTVKINSDFGVQLNYSVEGKSQEIMFKQSASDYQSISGLYVKNGKLMFRDNLNVEYKVFLVKES